MESLGYQIILKYNRQSVNKDPKALVTIVIISGGFEHTSYRTKGL